MSERSPLTIDAHEIERRQVVDFLKKAFPHRVFTVAPWNRNNTTEQVIIIDRIKVNNHSPGIFGNTNEFRAFTQELARIDNEMRHCVTLKEHEENYYLVIHQISKFAERIRIYEKENKIYKVLDFDTLFLLVSLLTSSENSWEERDESQIVSPLSDYIQAAVMVSEIKSCLSAIGISYVDKNIFSARSATAGKYRVVIEAHVIDTLSCTTLQKLISYLSDKQKNAIERQFEQFQGLINKLKDIILLDNPMSEAPKLF